MLSEDPSDVYELLHQYNIEKNMEQLPLSVRNLQLILNTKNPTTREMLMVISTYQYEIGNAAKCVSSKELELYFMSRRQLLFCYCVAKRYYLQTGVTTNIEPMERVPEHLLEEGEYYFDEYGDMYIYDNKVFKEVALTKEDFQRDDFKEIPVQAFCHRPKLTLLRSHE